MVLFAKDFGNRFFLLGCWSNPPNWGEKGGKFEAGGEEEARREVTNTIVNTNTCTMITNTNSGDKNTIVEYCYLWYSIKQTKPQEEYCKLNNGWWRIPWAVDLSLLAGHSKHQRWSRRRRRMQSGKPPKWVPCKIILPSLISSSTFRWRRSLGWFMKRISSLGSETGQGEKDQEEVKTNLKK